MFGSLGLALEEIYTRVTAWPAEQYGAKGPSSQRAEKFAQQVISRHQLAHQVRIDVDTAIPEHAGLGSGTQLGLAVGTAVTRLCGLDVHPQTLASYTERGARSGIGVGAFQHGGFLVDGGRHRDTQVPPVVCRVPFPDQWRIVLAFDNSRTGLNGSGESTAFEQLTRMDSSAAAHLCRLVLMRILPAISETNLAEFQSRHHGASDRGGRLLWPSSGWAVQQPIGFRILTLAEKKGYHWSRTEFLGAYRICRGR